MIFTNIVMPGGMNGDECAEAVFAAKPDLKVFTHRLPRADGGAPPGAWLKKPYAAADLAEKNPRDP